MNILMVYPSYPDTYWSFKHALRFISKKAAVPPLGLITVSAMLPGAWSKKLVDLNTTRLRKEDILWADYVFLSAMYIQKTSVDYVIAECRKHGVKIIAGGPLFTQEFNNYPEIDHFILNEAEVTLPQFLKDIDNGITPERIYETGEFADMKSSPVPDFHLLSTKDYAFMGIQVTRGCPFNCDFCEVTSLLGHKVRMKTTQQILDELDALYNLNWRGPVSIVDDNFIGRKKDVKEDLLQAMKKWMQEHKYPFTFNIQTSLNLAEEDELLDLLMEAGFNSTFIGIETPDETALHECHKVQNENKDMLQCIKKIQQAGMQVSGGFIVGFDSDTSTIFQRQINFIQQSGIVSAMVGLLNAPKNTKLYQRLEAEDRLTTDPTGNNTDCSMNFIPKMNQNDLLEGYQKIIKNIYSVKPYYKRIRQFLMNYRRKHKRHNNIKFSHINAFLKAMLIIGIINKGRTEYWKFFIWTLFKRPKLFMDAMTYAVYGYHFRTVFGLRRKNRYGRY